MIISWERSKHDQKIAIFRSEILSCLQIHILIIATNLKLQTYVDNKPRTEHIYIFTLRMDSYITWNWPFIFHDSQPQNTLSCTVYMQSYHDIFHFVNDIFQNLFHWYTPLVVKVVTWGPDNVITHSYTSNISIVKTLVSCSLEQYHQPVILVC